MIGRAKQIAWILLITVGLAAGAAIIPRLESQRSLQLLKQNGATFDVAEDGSIWWMTLPPERTSDETLRLLRNNSGLRQLTLRDCTITDAGLQNLGALENLKTLDVRGTRHLDDALRQLRGCTGLTELRLADCPWLNDDSIAAITEFADLSSLNLSGTSISNASVDHLLQLEHLVELDLMDCPNITEAGIRRLITLPNLTALNVAGTSISIEFWKQLPTLRPEMRIGTRVDRLPAFTPLIEAGGRFSPLPGRRSANLFSINGPVEPDLLARLGELEWRLASLSIRNCPVGDADLQWLANLNALQSLNLSRTNVTDNVVRSVSDCPLNYLDLSETTVTDRALEHLAGVSTLQSLYLRETAVRGAGFAGFTGMRDLSSIDLSRTPLNDDGAAHLARLPAVQFLRLTETALTDTGLAALGAAPTLQSLAVGSAAIEGEGLAGLSRSATIRSLSLECPQLRDDTLRHLAGFASLRWLELQASSVGDGGVRNLAEIENLNMLRINGTRLSPEIASALDRMPALELLILHGAISDDLLAPLAAVRSLNSLDLSSAEYNEEAVAALEAALPELRIIR